MICGVFAVVVASTERPLVVAVVIDDVDVPVSTVATLIVPVHEEPSGQQATWPAWSRAQGAVVWQQLPAWPKLEHDS